MYNYVEDFKIIWGKTMKPRIFISSTFYDLKYIREDLANFVRAHDYEPVLFEDGDIGYTPGKELDKSCYESMKNSDMVIIIIGGEYGSAATGEKKESFEEYISITRNEFRSAVESGIPIYVMIDKNVSTEYGIYEENYDAIEVNKKEIRFKATKNINVFRFIKEIKSIVTIPVQEFTKASEIKEFVAKQWSDMFKAYLVSLRRKKESNDIGITISDLNTIVSEMRVMLNAIGQKVIADDKTVKMEEILDEQSRIKMRKIVQSLGRSMTCEIIEDMSDSEAVEELINICYRVANKFENKTDPDKFIDDFLIEMKNTGLKPVYFFNTAMEVILDEEFLKKDNRALIREILLEKKIFNNLFVRRK